MASQFIRRSFAAFTWRHYKPRKLAQALAAILRSAEDLRVEVPGKREVLAGPFALETVLHNLVRNARQHAPGATVTIRARIVQNRPRR